MPHGLGRPCRPPRRLAVCAAFAAALLAAAAPAAALNHHGSNRQFAGGFVPASAPFGGFGGGRCTARRVPVVFLPGNGDDARSWDLPASTGGPSVYETFRAAGYEDCELFGVNYLSAAERAAPEGNYHRPASAELVAAFIAAVLDHTGAEAVDVVAHSLGVTVGLHALDRAALWPRVRRFVAIGGALRGLGSCHPAGHADPAVATCGSQNGWARDVFGFHPHTPRTPNPRFGDGGFRDRPDGRRTLFYSLRAGRHDQVHCSTAGERAAACWATAMFDPYPNVVAQLDVGAGTTAGEADYDFAAWERRQPAAGDLDGVGHYRAQSDTGVIQLNMLTTACTGAACCSGYADPCIP